MTPPRELTLQFLAEPADVNFGGKVHGGMVMKWIDQAGYACAAGPVMALYWMRSSSGTKDRMASIRLDFPAALLLWITTARGLSSLRLTAAR